MPVLNVQDGHKLSEMTASFAAAVGSAQEETQSRIAEPQPITTSAYGSSMHASTHTACCPIASRAFFAS